MSKIGIIANPASGKDIRRLVAHATIIDNNEKVNIVKRIILASQELGVNKIYIMADTFNIGHKAIEDLVHLKQLKAEVEILDMTLTASFKDTMVATSMLEQKGVGCIVSLGGDGTNRAIAKVIKDTPLLAISTGTNNVYPSMVEGTVAGIAAAVVASGLFDKAATCNKNKRLEVYKGRELIDIALIDAVVSRENFIGAKAIWEPESITDIFVTRAHPASIGFSSIVGYKEIIDDGDDVGAHVQLGVGSETILAPIASGVVRKINIKKFNLLKLDEDYIYNAENRGIIALDGEREIPVKAGDCIIFRISRNGPYQVDIRRTLEIAKKSNFFRKV
ncbi:MAG: NAD(+)/NADH kinase [Thermosediminibacteraceae bacterium]|nr:NAD(+)/NADH kinase [Thermosediminibacteraceae bacterium]